MPKPVNSSTSLPCASHPPVQVTLEQTATAIRSIHPRMGDAVDGPGGINRPRKRKVVGHSKLRTRRHHFLATRLEGESFQFFPTTQPARPETCQKIE